jgi:hypothetical protein
MKFNILILREHVSEDGKSQFEQIQAVIDNVPDYDTAHETVKKQLRADCEILELRPALKLV